MLMFVKLKTQEVAGQDTADIGHRMLCHDEQKWSFTWHLDNIFNSSYQRLFYVSWHLSIITPFLV